MAAIKSGISISELMNQLTLAQRAAVVEIIQGLASANCVSRIASPVARIGESSSSGSVSPSRTVASKSDNLAVDPEFEICHICKTKISKADLQKHWEIHLKKKKKKGKWGIAGTKPIQGGLCNGDGQNKLRFPLKTPPRAGSAQ